MNSETKTNGEVFCDGDNAVISSDNEDAEREENTLR